MNIYYVYQYLREDMTPYYIGKGSKGRAYKSRRAIPKPKDKNRIQIIAHKLSESEAFLLEMKLIQLYGRKDLGTGILRNMTNGGEGSSGSVWTKEAKLAVSKAKTEWHKNNDISGKNNPMHGRKHSREVCDASRERAIRTGFIGNRKGKDPWNKGLTTGPRGPNKTIKEKVPCPCCGMLVAKNILARFHGDKCKLNI